MIKCRNCGVLFDGSVAVCPVCRTVDAENLIALSGAAADIKQLGVAEAVIKDQNNAIEVEKTADNASDCLTALEQTETTDTVFKVESLGKGALRVAIVDNHAFKVVSVRKHRGLAPVHIYTIVALLAVIIGALINYFVTPHILWSPIVLIAMAYGLFTLLNTVESQTGTSVKIAYQIAAVALGFYFSSLLFPYREWYAEYCLPTIMLVGMTMQFMFMLETHNKFRPHYVSTVCVAILGYIPIIVALMQDVYLITAYVSAGVATFIILLTFIAGGRAMWTEMRGRFEY